MLEMTVTLGIISAMLVLTLPNLQMGRDRERLRSQAQILESDLRQAQARSIAANVQGVDPTNLNVAPVMVQLDQKNNLYRIFKDNNGNGVLDFGEVTQTVNLHPKVRFGAFSGPCQSINGTILCTVAFDSLTGQVPAAQTQNFSFELTQNANNPISKTVTVSANGLISLN